MVDTTNLYLNESLPGPLEALDYSKYRSSWPVPTTNSSCSAGNGILQPVIDTYKGREPTYNYTAPFPYDAMTDLDLGVAFSRNDTTYVSGVNTTSAIGHALVAISSKSANTASKASRCAESLVDPASSIPLAVALCSLLCHI